MSDARVRSTEERLNVLMSDLGLTRKGARRVLNIVQAGLEVLLESGFTALTKRRIASKLGISHGNIGYYFPTREALWRAVINYELREYHFTHNIHKPGPGNPQQRFDDYICSWIDEYNDRTVRIFFSHIIAFAEVNSYIAGIRDEVYEDYFSTALSRARALQLDVDDNELEQRVLTVIVMLEGLHAVSAFRPQTIEASGSFRTNLLVLANKIIRDG